MVSVSNEFVFKSVIFAALILFLLPTMVSVFIGTSTGETDDGSFSYDLSGDLMSGYSSFTGQEKKVNEEIWVLRGVYTPYGIDADGDFTNNYLYTADNWLSGAMIESLTPAQYVDDGNGNNFTVEYDDLKKCYVYTGTTRDGHKAGDVYTSVTMDYNHRSDVFFTSSGKHSQGKGFFYDFSGWRYSFVPQNSFYVSDQDGNTKNVIATQTSLSLIWYDIYGGLASGLSGNLVISGNDSGVSYLDAESIKREMGQNYVAAFPMTFNGGVEMTIYVKMNPYYLSRGWSVEQCWNAGYWSVMVTSISTDIETYTSTGYTFNIQNIWETFLDLFTFNTADYNMSPMASTICSITISLCLYAILLSIGVTCWPVLLLAGAVAALQAFNFADIVPTFQWPWD